MVAQAQQQAQKHGLSPSDSAYAQEVEKLFREQVNAMNTARVSDMIDLTNARSDGNGKGGLSLTNTMDITRAIDVLKYFPEHAPAVVIEKHTIVSGFAKQVSPAQTLVDLYRAARDSDRRSNFGGTVAFNVPIDMATAEAINELRPSHFADVVAAPGFEPEVLEFLEKSKNTRIAQFSPKGVALLPKFQGDNTHGLVSLRDMPAGEIGVQDLHLTSIRKVDDLVLDPMITEENGTVHVVETDPSPEQHDDILTSWWVNITGTRSNGIVFIKDGQLVSAMSGQTERVGAVEQALVKGIQKAMDRENITYDPLYGITGIDRLRVNPFKGAIGSSDGFFPHPDSVTRMGQLGVVTVIQPYGSLKDAEVIDEANRLKMAMPATRERGFKHF